MLTLGFSLGKNKIYIYNVVNPRLQPRVLTIIAYRALAHALCFILNRFNHHLNNPQRLG
jgi:hypothetical protein